MTSSGRTVLVASLLLLAACSSHASSPTATSRPTTTTTTTTTTTATSTTTIASTTTAPPPTNTATTARPATTVATPRQAPAGDAFYTPPSPLPAGQPGDLIWARPLADDGTRNAWQILYLSQTVDGAPVAVSGLVVTPKTAATGPRDVLAWAHGTTGLGDTCAISRQYVDGSGSETLLTSLAAPLGLAFVATDYQGLGTPGGHTFLVGQAEGRDVLDAVRATAQVPESGVTAASRTIIWGHSQGGGRTSLS